MRLSITHSQAGLCCIGPPSARPGTFYEMFHTATLAPCSNPKTNPRRTGVSFPPAPPSIATRAGTMGLCGMEDELVHGYRSM